MTAIDVVLSTRNRQVESFCTLAFNARIAVCVSKTFMLADAVQKVVKESVDNLRVEPWIGSQGG